MTTMKRLIIAAVLVIAAQSAHAVIGDSAQQFKRRFQASVNSYGDWLFCDNGHWRTMAFTLNDKIEGETYIAMTPASNSTASIKHQLDRQIASYTGRGRYAKRWSRYAIQGGFGYSRSDGKLFIEVTTNDDGFFMISVASLLGYRWIMGGHALESLQTQQSEQQQDEQPADQQKL